MPDDDPATLLTWTDRPAPFARGGTMLLALSGWMDGGDVSTGTVQRLIDRLDAQPAGEIDPDPFYIYNFPGSMEIAALFRPAIRIEGGRLRSLDMPENTFHAHADLGLLLFVGQEPNLRWPTFGDLLLQAARDTNVKRIVFVGSFAGSVPHTREPRLYATASSGSLLRKLRRYGVRGSDYGGPGSFVTYLISRAGDVGIEMVSLVAEIPAYIQGPNPASIEAVTRRLAAILELPHDLSELRNVSDAWESKVSEAVEDDPDLQEKIREMEQQYDDDLLARHAEFAAEEDAGE